ncbi:hypothetical protein [Mesobacillus zeae]|uniref:Uncharacterized protein n=1 Tax=Mesobacillus zeae TaxID=1917180 RepID=A0A398BMH1_9BACI|nr:hypothetical protein [Mesobacillus zeae]RID88960.1 hypothetical protein D1970_00215 [Mesobacillus zeae]
MADYKTKLHEAITELQQATKRGEMPREVRIVKIEALVEDYFAKAGEMPDSTALERLADLCLHEELTDTNEHKISQTEYPFLSERQFDRRDNREVKSTTGMDGNAADGQKHGVPTRRKRTDYENRFVDKKSRIRNKERKHRYVEFTKVQPVVVYKLGDSRA